MGICVTVIVPVYNGELLIRRCLESILSQEDVGPVEVLVVDDGSTDGTRVLVEGLEDPRVRVITQENKGVAAARNAGVKQAQGTYLAFLDADDYWETTFLSETVSFLVSHPEAIAVSVGQVHKCIGKPPAIAPAFLQDKSMKRESRVLNSFFEFWAQHNHVCTGSVLMRTEVAQESGGQRAEFKICEDLEFWAYLATFGSWGFIPKILFVSDGGVITRAQGWLEKNRKRWESAPTVEAWQARIVGRIKSNDLVDYEMARARIAKNLTYSMILSHRDELARETCSYFEKYIVDRMATLMISMAKTIITWKGMCMVLRWRELWRDRTG